MVVHSTDRARYVKIGRELSREFSGVQILQRAVRQAVEGVDGCDFAGVSLRSHHGQVQTPAWTSPAVWAADAMQVPLGEGPSLEPMWVSDCATDEIAARLEDLQDVLGEEPGADAYTTGRMVRAALDERASRRWPEWSSPSSGWVLRMPWRC